MAVVLAVAAVPFSLLLLFVESRWEPLLELDNGARDGLHTYALSHPLFVTIMRVVSNSGSALAWQIVTVGLAVVLLVRRRIRLAVFVIVTNAGVVPAQHLRQDGNGPGPPRRQPPAAPRAGHELPQWTCAGGRGRLRHAALRASCPTSEGYGAGSSSWSRC